MIMPVADVSKTTTPMLGAPQSGGNTLSSLDFMHLLVVELQNQNPLEPMSTTDMASQLSQMTMAQQLTEINQAMDANLTMSQSINNTGMLALVGRSVTVEGSEVHVIDGAVSGSMINSKAPGTATVVVKDADGNEVATYVKSVNAGLSELDWDGLLANGEPAADGVYSISVQVNDADAGDVESTVLMTGPVLGLRYDQGLAVVNVFGTEYFVSEIYQVS
jgi:flagellar basal-body rod modification protein FlgD